MSDGKVYAADKNMNRLTNVFLNIIKIIREEYRNQKYEYYTGPVVKIFLNETEVGPDVNISDFQAARDQLWNVLKNAPRGNGITCDTVETFLSSIYVTKLKAPAAQQNEFFGGTQDITMQVQDYRNGIASVIGFS